MKKVILSLLFMASACAVMAQKAQVKTNASKSGKAPVAKAAEAPAIKSLPLGSMLPDGMPMQSTTGRLVTMQEMKTEKGLLVMFSCNTCPYVIKGQPRTAEAMDLAFKLRIGMIIINSNEAKRGGEDSPEAMRAYADEQRYIVPYVADINAQVADAFGASRTPEVFLFNGEGKLVYKGAMEDNPSDPAASKVKYLADAMNALSEQKPIKVAETKSIGCSIKRIPL